MGFLISMIEGVGLGLTISRNLAKALGGDLKVESTIGVGSRFILTIPMHVCQSEPNIKSLTFNRTISNNQQTQKLAAALRSRLPSKSTIKTLNSYQRIESKNGMDTVNIPSKFGQRSSLNNKVLLQQDSNINQAFRLPRGSDYNNMGIPIPDRSSNANFLSLMQEDDFKEFDMSRNESNLPRTAYQHPLNLEEYDRQMMTGTIKLRRNFLMPERGSQYESVGLEEQSYRQGQNDEKIEEEKLGLGKALPPENDKFVSGDSDLTSAPTDG